MRWNAANHIITSMQGLLSGSADEVSRTAVRIDDIRQTMLDSLGDAGCMRYPHIERKILFACDLQGLWFLRGDVMAALSSLQGEFQARQTLRQITDMFEGLLPKGMISRPSPLDN